MKLEFSRQIYEKSSNIKFHKNPSSERRVVPWGRTDGHTGCPGRNVPDFGRMFLKLKYTDITQNTYIQSWTVTEIMAREKCGLLAVPRTVPGSRDVLPYRATSCLVFTLCSFTYHAHCAKILIHFCVKFNYCRINPSIFVIRLQLLPNFLVNRGDTNEMRQVKKKIHVTT